MTMTSIHLQLELEARLYYLNVYLRLTGWMAIKFPMLETLILNKFYDT